MSKKKQKKHKKYNSETHAFLHRFFNFFSLPGFVSRKWLKKLCDSLNNYFHTSKKLTDLIRLKDSEIDNFNIDNLIDAIGLQNEYLENYYTDYSAIEDTTTQNGNKLLDNLESLISMQDNYNWFNPTDPVKYAWMEVK